MSTCQMARLMRDHADDLIGRIGLHDGARVDENASTIDEGVEALRIDKDDAHATAGKTGGLQDRRCIICDQRLDFRVAHNWYAARLGGGGDNARNRHGKGRKCRHGTANETSKG